MLEGHRLGAAEDLAGEVAVEGIDGATGEGFVFGEEVTKNLLVVVATVGKNRDCSGYMLVEGVIAVEEALGDAQFLAGFNGNDLVIFE